ncbi:MAG: hypothetical protein V4436_02445 [Patescibacteria group bacterium]
MPLKVPSGRVFEDSDLKLMKMLVEVGFIRWLDEPVLLKSGIESRVYVFGRNDLTENASVLRRVGARIIQELRYHTDNERSGFDNSNFCLIGIPTAGTALAIAASQGDASAGARIMREVKKIHGAHNTWVEGEPMHEKHRYVLVDNVATDGKSKREAAAKLIEDGYDISEVDCLILVDRQQGALKNIESLGFRRVLVVYNLLDMTFAFRHLKLWPEEAVLKVEQEIAAHQQAFA